MSAGNDSPDPTGPVSGAEYDRQIEEDIRALRRSSRWLAYFGTLAFGLIVVLVAMEYMKSSAALESHRSYIDIVFTAGDNSKVYSAKGTSFEVLRTLSAGEPLFLLNRDGEWSQVRKGDMEGWIRSEDLSSRNVRSVSPAAAKTEKPPIQISDVDWVVDDEVENYTIVGKIENVTDIPISNCKISVNFYNKDSKPIGTKSTVVSRDEPFRKGEKYNFTISGQHRKDYAFVNYLIESWQ